MILNSCLQLPGTLFNPNVIRCPDEAYAISQLLESEEHILLPPSLSAWERAEREALIMSLGDAPSSGKDAMPMLVVMISRFFAPLPEISSFFKVRWILSATSSASFLGVEGKITQNSASPNRPTRSMSRSDPFRIRAISLMTPLPKERPRVLLTVSVFQD